MVPKLLIKQCLSRLLPHWIKRLAVKRKYDSIAALSSDELGGFMNEGYASLDPDEPVPELSVKDELFPFHIQLYFHLATAVEWNDKEVLEVGCGRGGAASI